VSQSFDGTCRFLLLEPLRFSYGWRMSKARTQLRFAVEPVVAVLFFLAWFGVNRASMVTYVPVRDDTFTTGPYAVAVAVGFAFAIALCRVSPIAAFSIVGGLLLAQTLFWPARFSQVSWDAYLGLLFLSLAAAIFGGRLFRWIALGLSIVFATAVSALLNFPELSMSGRWGTINGLPNSAPAMMQGFVIWAVVVCGLVVGAWFVGRAIRLRTRGARLAPKAASDDVRARDASAIKGLSERERDIFLLAAEGLTNREIAQRASIAESTVKSHLNSISTKLGLASRAQLVAYAYRTGILQPTSRG
jgi:DNA-binding CsgD family transcriptional regulator